MSNLFNRMNEEEEKVIEEKTNKTVKKEEVKKVNKNNNGKGKQIVNEGNNQNDKPTINDRGNLNDKPIVNGRDNPNDNPPVNEKDNETVNKIKTTRFVESLLKNKKEEEKVLVGFRLDKSVDDTLEEIIKQNKGLKKAEFVNDLLKKALGLN